MELLAELAMRFPKGGDGNDDAVRLRLLAEDLSETMDPEALKAAIAEGRKTWRFLPTLADILAAAQPFLADRRDRARAERERREASERRALPAPVYADVPTHDIKALLAKLDEGNRAYIATFSGHSPSAAITPHGERTGTIATPATSDASPRLKALVSSGVAL